MLERLLMTRTRPHVKAVTISLATSRHTGAVIPLKPRFWECWTTFIVLQTTARDLCCCSSTCHAGFDTLDKTTVLQWPAWSYLWRTRYITQVGRFLPQRTLPVYVRVGDRVSPSVGCDYGIPQGSVLGPLLLTIYISPMINVIDPFRDIHHAQYANDTQLYIAVSTDSAFSVINDCFF